MFDFPKSTAIHRRIPKEAFYKRVPMTGALKKKFISDVDKIYLENSFTKESLHLSAGSVIKEILFLKISIKNPDFDSKIIDLIARHNPHKMVLSLSHDNSCLLAIYQDRLYLSSWLRESQTNLKLQGFSLDEIWEHFIEQIALTNEETRSSSDLSIDERLALQNQIDKLNKQIQKIELATWKEEQPKKKFELYSLLQAHKQELEKLKNG